MPGKSPWKMAVASTAIVLLAAGCGGGDSDDANATPNSVVIGIAEPEHLLPSNTTDSNGSAVLSSLFYPLVKFNGDVPVEAAAESITTKNNQVWTIKLKPNFTFHNGEPVTSDNYIAAWNYAAYGPNGQSTSYFFARIAGYEALQVKDPDGEGPEKAPAPEAKELKGLKKIDDLTFQVSLSAPFFGWKSVMGYDCFLPLPKAAFSAPGVIAEGFEEKIIGNGPFKLKGKWEHDQKVVVEKVANFKGLVPRVDGITWKIYQDLQAEYADLVAGNVDVQTQIPIESLSTASSDLGDRFQKSENSSFDFLGFPLFDPAYSNPKVRRAISKAINREEITEQIFRGSRKPADAFVSPVVDGDRPGACGDNCVYSPPKALELYREGGGPQQIKITYNADGNHKAWIDATCNQIKAALKVDCRGEAVPKFSDLLGKLQRKENVGLFRLSWGMDYPLMENFLGPLYSTDGSSNYYGYSNTAFDNLVKAGSAAATPEKAVKKWQEAEDILVQDMPVIPLRFGQNVFGYSERVTNVTMDEFMKVDIYKLEVVI